MTAGEAGAADKRFGQIAPGANADTWSGLMMVNASTGEMTPILRQRAPSNGVLLSTGLAAAVADGRRRRRG